MYTCSLLLTPPPPPCVSPAQYGGSFDSGLSFETICALFALPCLLMVPVSWLYVHEERVPRIPRGGTRRYFRGVWGLLCSNFFFSVIFFQFIYAGIGTVSSPAIVNMQRYWAGVQNLQKQMFRLLSQAVFAFGLALTKRYLLNYSWRRLLVITVLSIIAVDAVFTSLTVFDGIRNQVPRGPRGPRGPPGHLLSRAVGREGVLPAPARLGGTTPCRRDGGSALPLLFADHCEIMLALPSPPPPSHTTTTHAWRAHARAQYFFLGEAFVTELPSATQFLITTFIVVEAADADNGGLVYGLLTTAHNLGLSFARPFSNQIFGSFHPSLSDSANFIKDTPAFRTTVMWSVVLAYVFSLISFVVLPLLPDQKVQAQERKRTWSRSSRIGYLTVIFLLCTFVYSVTLTVLTMFPSTACLRLVGGPGCDSASERR